MYGEPSIEAENAWCLLWAAAGGIIGGVCASVFAAPAVIPVALAGILGGVAGAFVGAETVYSETAQRVGIYLANRIVPLRNRILASVLKDSTMSAGQGLHIAAKNDARETVGEEARPSSASKSMEDADIKNLKRLFNGEARDTGARDDSRHDTELGEIRAAGDYKPVKITRDRKPHFKI